MVKMMVTMMVMMMVNISACIAPDRLTGLYSPLLPEHPRLLSTPVFHFEVASIDTWDRHRTEGYGHWSLPSQPGLYTGVVSSSSCSCCMLAVVLLGSYCPSILMWRPMGNTLLDELRRFFIGGGPQLEDITYSGVPADVKVCVISTNNKHAQTHTCTRTNTHSILFAKTFNFCKGPHSCQVWNEDKVYRFCTASSTHCTPEQVCGTQ